MPKDSQARRVDGAMTGWATIAASDAAFAASRRRRIAHDAGGPELEALPGRCRATVCGVLRSVVMRPHAYSCSTEAELCDGTDTVVLIWLGRTSVPGIEPGRALRVEGAITDRGGRRVVYNPRYELLPTSS